MISLTYFRGKGADFTITEGATDNNSTWDDKKFDPLEDLKYEHFQEPDRRRLRELLTKCKSIYDGCRNRRRNIPHSRL